MPRKADVLTDHAVRTMKPSKGQAGWKSVTDGGCKGLVLRLSPKGEKLWVVRVEVNGSRQWKPIGGYPSTSLADARERAKAYASSARDGLSPAEMDARQAAETMTVADAHRSYITTMRANLRASTVALKETMFTTHIDPVIGGRLVRTVRKADVVDVVGRVAGKGFVIQANRVYSELMALLRWCENKGYVDGVPSVRKKDMRHHGAGQEKPRGRTLTESELKSAWNAATGLGELTNDYIRLLIITGQRRDEVRLMEWGEVDLESGLWTIPAKKYKTNINHCVPLSPQAKAILKARWREGASGYVLQGREPGKPFNGALSALRRLRKAVNNSDFTLHDIRRTVRTGLARLGVDEATAEMVIGHIPQGIVRVYDQHDRLSERLKALSDWADYVERL